MNSVLDGFSSRIHMSHGGQTASSRLGDIIPTVPSRYLRRDTLVDLCCNSSQTTLAREHRAIARDLFSSIAHVPRLFFQVSLSAAGPIYCNPAAVVGRTFILLSFAFRRRFGREICERIPLWHHETWDFCSNLSLSLFLFFYAAASVILNRGSVEIVAICCSSSFFRQISNASLFGRKTNFRDSVLTRFFLIFLFCENSGFLRPSHLPLNDNRSYIFFLGSRVSSIRYKYCWH